MAEATSKTSLVLFAMRIAQMVLNVVTVSLTAKFFGISMERDMWVFTNSLVVTITGMFWGPVNEVFRAKFIFVREEEGEQMALRRTKSLFSFVTLSALVIGVLMAVFSHHIADLLVADAAAVSVFWKIFLLLIPTLLVRELTLLCTSLLNAYSVFYIPEYANLISGFVNILLIAVLSPVIGIYSLLVATYFSLAVLLIAVVYFIRTHRIGLTGQGRWLDFGSMMPFLMFALPLYFPYFVGQFNEIVQNTLADSLGSGTISTLGYSKQFSIIVQGIMSSVLATVMMPVLAQAFKQSDEREYVKVLSENVLLYMAIYGVFACATIGAADPVCRLLFQYGKMSAADVERVILLTRLFSAAFLGVVFYMVFSIGLLTTGRNKIYAFIGSLTQLMVLLLNVLLIRFIGVYAFPLSYGVAHLSTGLYMFFSLRIEGKHRVALCILRSMVSIALGVGIFSLWNVFADAYVLPVQVGTNIVLAMLVVPCMLYLMGLPVIRIVEQVRRRLHL